MDDELTDNSADGYLWYQLGRQAAEGRRNQDALMAELTGTALVSRREYDRVVQIARQWQAECVRLQGLNNQLAAQLNTSADDYTKLKSWADACAARRDDWKQQLEQQVELTRGMSNWANRLLDELERHKETGG